MKDRKNFEAVAAALTKAQKIVVISHYNPDADAYGATGAITNALRAMGKTVYPVNENGAVDRYLSLPIVNEISASFPEGEWDCLCVVDCGDVKRLGDSLLSHVSSFSSVVSIDHHASNTRFGVYNWIEEEESSTSQMLYTLIKHLGVALSQDIARSLMAGIIGDTGFFRYRSTTPETMEIAAELMRAGAVPADIGEPLYFSTPASAVKFQGRAISEVELLEDGKIAWVKVSQQLLQQFGAELEDADVLVDRARDIAGVRVAVLIREVDDLWRVSLRSKRDIDDVSVVATSFGGGGHKMAAAFRWREGYDELQALLTSKLKEVVK